jgi:hypothetical protein
MNPSPTFSHLLFKFSAEFMNATVSSANSLNMIAAASALLELGAAGYELEERIKRLEEILLDPSKLVKHRLRDEH